MMVTETFSRMIQPERETNNLTSTNTKGDKKMDAKKKTRQTWKRYTTTGLVELIDKDPKGKEISSTTIADATILFPEYNSFNNKKRDIILYGIEQRVCDKIAAQKDKTIEDYRDVYNNILDGSFYEKKKVTRLTVTKKAEAMDNSGALSDRDKMLLKKLGILK